MNCFFFCVDISDLSLKVPVNFNEDLKAEFEIGRSKTVFHFPFSHMIVQATLGELQGVKLTIRSKHKAIGQTLFSIDKDAKETSQDLVIFSVQDAYHTKSVAGTLHLKVTPENLTVFPDNFPSSEIFEFSNQDLSDLLKFIRKFQTNDLLEPFEISLETTEKSSEISRKLKKINTLLKGLNEKLKVLQVFKEKNTFAIENLRQKDLMIFDLHQELKDISLAFDQSKFKYEEIIEKQSIQIMDQMKKVEGLEEKVRIFSNESEKHRTEVDLLRSEIAKFHDQERLIKNSEKMIKELKKTIKNYEETVSKGKKDSETLQTSNLENLEIFQENIDLLMKENESLAKKVDSLKVENFTLQSKLDSISSQYLSLKNSFLSENSFETLIKDLNLKSSQFEESSKSFKSESLSLKDQLEKHNKRFQEVSKESQKEKLHIHKHSKSLLSEISSLKTELLSKSSEISTISTKMIELKSQPLSSRDYSKLESQSTRAASEIKTITSCYENFEKDYKVQQDFLLNSYISLSQRHLVVQRNLTRIVSLLKEKEKEIPMLREMIAEMKSRQLYIPVSGDVIDNYLANYINSRSEKLEVPFVRLYHGMYLFGSKKVSMKIENSGIVIRLGGGFSNIDDFIKNNTENEIEKISEGKKEQERNRSASPEERNDREEFKFSRKLDRTLTMMLGKNIKSNRSSISIDRKPGRRDSVFS